MGPPLQYEPTSFTQAAKSISGAAWSISEIASTLTNHQAGATTQEIKDALFTALNACTTELLTAHGDVERLAYRVQAVGGVMFGLDQRWGQRVEGSDYDTRYFAHPYVFAFPDANPPFQSPFLLPYGVNGRGPYPLLPGQ